MIIEKQKEKLLANRIIVDQGFVCLILFPFSLGPARETVICWNR